MRSSRKSPRNISRRKLGCFHSASREASATFLDSSSLTLWTSFAMVHFPLAWQAGWLAVGHSPPRALPHCDVHSTPDRERMVATPRGRRGGSRRSAAHAERRASGGSPCSVGESGPEPICSGARQARRLSRYGGATQSLLRILPFCLVALI